MMEKDVKVSVAIPTFNRVELLKRALDSVLKQTYKNIEIIISDNASVDNTQEFCLEYAKKYPNIRYFRQKKNIGIGANAKFLVSKARGEYFCILNDDDFINSIYIEECLKTLDKNDVLCTLGKVCLVDEQGSLIRESGTFSALFDTKEQRCAQYVKTGINAFIFSAFCKTEIYEKCYTNYDSDRFCEDQIGAIKFLCEGKFLTSKKALYYKLNNGSTKDLDTLKKSFNLPDLTHENYFSHLALTHKNAILEDIYYKDYWKNDYKAFANFMENEINNLKPKPKKKYFSIRNLFKKKFFKKRKQYSFQKNNNSVFLKSFSVRGQYENKVEIGSDCMLGCNLIFESKDGGKIKIGDRTFINGGGTSLISRNSIEIGDNVTIAWGCTIYDHNSHSLDWRERRNDALQQLKDYREGLDFIENKNWNTVKSRPIKIEDKVWLGFNVTVLSGVTIGEGAIVGACSVVREDVEPYTVVAGNPAVKIRDIER